MQDKDIRIIATNCVYEILLHIGQSYEALTDCEVQKKVLNALVDNGDLKKRMVNILASSISDVVTYAELEVHKIATGQKNLPGGGRVVAGFQEKKG